MRSHVLTLIAAAALVSLGAAGAQAQEATPTTGSLFAGLGLPELTITATDEGFTLDQSEVEAGRYLVTLNNESANPQIYAGFVQLAEGKTIEDLSYADEVAAGTPPSGPEEMPPPEVFAWLYETYIAGGIATLTGSSAQGIVDLPAGEYGVWNEDPAGTVPAAALTVTGEAGRVEGPEPDAAVTIIQEGEGGVGYSFRVDGDFQPGPQVVEVLNASDQPHFTEASQYPEPITIEQVMEAFTFVPEAGGTPSPEMIDFERVTFAGWAGAQSAGTTQWVVMDFQPGQQAVLACFIPDPLAEGTPHAFEGMLQLFNVAE